MERLKIHEEFWYNPVAKIYSKLERGWVLDHYYACHERHIIRLYRQEIPRNATYEEIQEMKKKGRRILKLLRIAERAYSPL